MLFNVLAAYMLFSVLAFSMSHCQHNSSLISDDIHVTNNSDDHRTVALAVRYIFTLTKVSL